MVKETKSQLWAWLVIGLLLGGLAGASIFVKEVEVEVIKEVEVESLCPTCAVCETEIIDDTIDYFAIATEVAMEEFLDDYDGRYNEDEIDWHKLYDEWSIEFDDEDYVVEFRAKISFDEDDEERKVKKYDFEVSYDADDDEFDVEWDRLRTES